MSTTSLPISCAARAAAAISSPTWTPYWSAIRTWNCASNPRTDQPRRRGSRLMIAWYRIGSSSRATTFGRRAKTSARIAAPMSKTWPTPRSVIIAGVTIPRATITLCLDEAAAFLESPGKPLPHDATVHADDIVRADPALPDGSLPRADVVDYRAVPSKIHDLSDLEFLVRRREDFVRHGPVSLVDGELDPDPVDPFRPDGDHFLRPRGRDAASLGLHRSDLDPGVSEVERLSHRDVLLGRELEGRALGLVEPRHDERDLDRFRFPGDDRGHAAAVRTFHGPLEDDLVLASDLAAKHAMGSLRPTRLALQDEGAWSGHRRVERRDGEKDLRCLETSTPSAVADDAPEPTSQGPGASRTSSRSDERLDPGLPRLRQVRPLRLPQDALQFGSRGEVSDGFHGDEAAATAPQREAHEQGRGREPEDERAHVGLPGDSERSQESEEAFEDEEDHDDLDHRQRRDPRDRQEQGDPVPGVESPIRPEDREDSSGGSDEQDHITEMDEKEDERSRRPSDEEQHGPAHAPDSLLERGRDQDESEEVQEDVRLRRMHELERDPGPRRGWQSGGGEESEFEGDGGEPDKSQRGRRNLEGEHRENRDRVDQGERRLPDESVRGREDDDCDRRDRDRLHGPLISDLILTAAGHTNLSRIKAIFSAAWPSPNDFDFVPDGLNFSIASRMSAVSVPTRAFQPSSTVSIHSVSSRRVTHGTPKKYASFCTPPLSVTTFEAPIRSAMKSR